MRGSCRLLQPRAPLPPSFLQASTMFPVSELAHHQVWAKLDPEIFSSPCRVSQDPGMISSNSCETAHSDKACNEVGAAQFSSVVVMKGLLICPHLSHDWL